MFIQLLGNGVITGSIYALIAIGFTSFGLGVQELMSFRV